MLDGIIILFYFNIVTWCTYTNLDSLAYYTPSLYRLLFLGYKPVQHVSVLIFFLDAIAP